MHQSFAISISDDSANIACVALGAVLSRDNSLVDVLDAATGSAFERTADGAAFVEP
ncbi:hypothetical protein [Dyella silvatica]|uniref:hypothetical protein n=1 Tax=Dyella silvatica TaxID=2992128 RepID=UPI00224D7357|nr:hypothetical protein [Dyella silvatica]